LYLFGNVVQITIYNICMREVHEVNNDGPVDNEQLQLHEYDCEGLQFYNKKVGGMHESLVKTNVMILGTSFLN
jgi:hypothetical protein